MPSLDFCCKIQIRIWRKPYKSIDPSCLLSTVQAAFGGVMVWGIFSWHTLSKKTCAVVIKHNKNIWIAKKYSCHFIRSLGIDVQTLNYVIHSYVWPYTHSPLILPLPLSRQFHHLQQLHERLLPWVTITTQAFGSQAESHMSNPLWGPWLRFSFFASNSKVCLGEALAIWVVIVVKIRLVTGKLQLPSRCIRLCWICLLFLRHSVTIGGLCQSCYTCRYPSLFSCKHTNTHNDFNILLPKVINPSCSCLFIQQEKQLFLVNLVC